jgi:hypothetical protein
MILRDLFLLAIGFMAGSLVQHIYENRMAIWKDFTERMRKSKVIYFPPEGPSLTLQLHSKDNPPPDGWKRWPPAHPGGAPETEVYRWAAELIKSTNITWQEAWDKVDSAFPGYCSQDKDLSKHQREIFRKGVKRAMEKTDTTPKR